MPDRHLRTGLDTVLVAAVMGGHTNKIAFADFSGVRPMLSARQGSLKIREHAELGEDY